MSDGKALEGLWGWWGEGREFPSSWHIREGKTGRQEYARRLGGRATEKTGLGVAEGS